LNIKDQKSDRLIAIASQPAYCFFHKKSPRLPFEQEREVGQSLKAGKHSKCLQSSKRRSLFEHFLKFSENFRRTPQHSDQEKTAVDMEVQTD
jgi:hypothetical protein